MNSKPILSVEATDAAHFAGFFDGEGSVNPYFAKNKRGDRNIGVLQVNVTNTNHEMLYLYQTAFGGCVTNERGVDDGKCLWRPTRAWVCTGELAINFLRIVFPYLKCKKRQAALAFKFHEIMQQNLRTKDAHRFERLKVLQSEIRSFNGFSGGGSKRKRAETVKRALERKHNAYHDHGDVIAEALQ